MNCIQAKDMDLNMMEILCVTKEIVINNDVAVLFHPKEITLEDDKLREIRKEFQFNEQCEKRRRKHKKKLEQRLMINLWKRNKII